MGQKDLTQKNLEHHPDVFADVINALLYGGKAFVRPENLRPAPTETLYHGTQKSLHNQFHDVSKYEMSGSVIKLQYTLENEMGCNSKMILRKAGYEGAVYREQYDRKVWETYPFIGIVLYWGRKSWNAPKSIHSFFRKSKLPKEVLHYVNNMRLQAYNMCNLPPEVRDRFHSDMRIVVDYLAEGKNYVPTKQKLKHPEDLLRMLQSLTGDERYFQIWNALQEDEKKGGVTMCELLDKYWNDGVATGMREGMKALVEICQDFGLTQTETAARVVQKFSLSKEESLACTQKYWSV